MTITIDHAHFLAVWFEALLYGELISPPSYSLSDMSRPPRNLHLLILRLLLCSVHSARQRKEADSNPIRAVGDVLSEHGPCGA